MTPQATRPPRRPRTDPAERPRARKAAAAEQSGRPAVRPTSRQIRRRRIAALVIAVVVLAGLAVGARAAVYDSGWFDVKDVKVTGVTTLAMADVLGAADVTPGRPLAEVDTRGIASRVAALSGVASVEVSRSWPHTVAVDVVERVPVAVASTPSGDQLVDTGGVVYAGKVVPNLPRMAFGPVGPTDAPTRAALAAFAAAARRRPRAGADHRLPGQRRERPEPGLVRPDRRPPGTVGRFRKGSGKGRGARAVAHPTRSRVRRDEPRSPPRFVAERSDRPVQGVVAARRACWTAPGSRPSFSKEGPDPRGRTRAGLEGAP